MAQIGKAPTSGRDQTAMYSRFNPEDTARGGLKTPMYGKGKITHAKVDYPEPGTPPNPTGHQHVSTGGKRGKR